MAPIGTFCTAETPVWNPARVAIESVSRPNPAIVPGFLAHRRAPGRRICTSLRFVASFRDLADPIVRVMRVVP